MKEHTQKFLQKRRFAMVLPVLVVPFLAVIFWAFGGGSGTMADGLSNEKAGFNTQLPDAHFIDEDLDKLMLYERAKRDSAKYRDDRKNDPYYDLAMLEKEDAEEILPSATLPVTIEKKEKNGENGENGKKFDPNEKKVNEKLNELYKELNRKPGNAFVSPEVRFDKGADHFKNGNTSDLNFTSDVEQLGGMMEMMKKGRDTGKDAEMNRINGVLEKILDVQHPERVREKIREQSMKSRGQVFVVDTNQKTDEINLIENVRGRLNNISTDTSRTQQWNQVGSTTPNSFFGLADELAGQLPSGNSIEAVVHDTQELVIGSVVKMRLLKDVYINGKLIPKDQFVFGTAAINGERLNISIGSIRCDDSLFPVSLLVFDLDGMEGIYIPGAISRDVAKQSSDQAMQGMQFMSMDQSVGAQAASAGMQAAKGLFSKKVRLIKVTVKAGYRIMLKDGNDKSNY